VGLKQIHLLADRRSHPTWGTSLQATCSPIPDKSISPVSTRKATMKQLSFNCSPYKDTIHEEVWEEINTHWPTTSNILIWYANVALSVKDEVNYPPCAFHPEILILD
jgi:hypothetical protein